MDDRLTRVIEHPLHRFLGITTIDSDTGNGHLAITVNDNTVNPAGVFHGGVLYLLCDVCAYGGLLSLLDADVEAATHDIHVAVMRAANRGDVVDFSSQIVKRGITLCFIDVTARVDDRVIATARVTKSIVRVQ